MIVITLYTSAGSRISPWAEWSVWTGAASGYCRTITWEVGYLPRLHPPCDVDRLCDYMTWQIKGSVVVVMTDRNENNSLYARDFAGGPAVGNLPVLTIQDPSDVQGAMVYDCQPPLLPVSLQLSDIGPLSGRPIVVSASVAVPPWEDGLTIRGVGSDVLVVPEFGVAPLVDSGTGLEDELPTPNGSPSIRMLLSWGRLLFRKWVLRLRAALILSWRRPFSRLPFCQ